MRSRRAGARREGVLRLLADGALAVEAGFLRQVGDPQTAPGRRPRRSLGVLDAGDDLEQGRFAGAVDADEGDMLLLDDLEGDAAEDFLAP